MVSVIERLHKLFAKARQLNIGIDFLDYLQWDFSSAHVSYRTFQQSYVTIGIKGLRTELLSAVIAHEIAHIEITKIESLELPRYEFDVLRHELYAWKRALENECIEDNPELFELAQLQLNRYLFGFHRALNDTTDTDAQTEELNRLSLHVQKRTQTFK